MGPAGPFFFDMATTYEKEKELESDIAPRVEHDVPGVEVLAVELESPDRFVVYVEHAEGVDHALCARVTDVIRDYLRDYTVTVSSPGTEPPLRKPAHFARVVGRRVKLRTRDGRVQGEVVAADETHVTIDENHVPYEQIVRANLIDER